MRALVAILGWLFVVILFAGWKGVVVVLLTLTLFVMLVLWDTRG